MSKKTLFCLFLIITSLTLHCCANEPPRLLLISFDGFRWNYLDRIQTPNFDKLIRDGVKVKWLQDVFVSQTFPNHYTLATGLYEESHGIVANKFYDPALQREFNYHTNAVGESCWWGGEPIWITSELQGKRAGVFFWVGSEAVIKNTRPTKWFPYSNNYPWTKRVDTVVDWLANNPTGEEKIPLNISLTLLYFPQPDHYGHVYGPESNEVTEMIGQCDDITGYLLDKLEENNLYDKVNIIITSDHGMASLSQNKTIPILPHLNIDQIFRLINYGTGAAIWPKKGFLDNVYEKMKNFSLYAKVWRQDDIPKQFRYNNNDRIPPILIMPLDGWYLVNSTDDSLPMNGSHGYNNSLMDMHPFFIAHGPAFRKGYVSEPFSSVNVYELICHIMGLKPAPNNGSLNAVKHILKDTWDYNFSNTFGEIVGIIFGVALALMVVVFIIIHFHQGRNRFGYKWISVEDVSEEPLPIKQPLI